MTNKLNTELIQKRIKLDPETECWNWTGSLQTCGYGQIRIGGSISQLVHRVSWTVYCGPIPDGVQVLHHCDNPKCCNPKHLYLGSHRDNMLDMIERKRRGKTGPKRKLTTDQIQSIRERQDTLRKLALEFGVAVTTIRRYRENLAL